MKNLAKSLIAASMFLAGSAIAVEDKLDDLSYVYVVGHVPVNCSIELGEGSSTIDLEHNPAVGERYTLDNKFTFTCNNKHGAILSMHSYYGGLAHEDSEDHTINYGAWLQLFDLEEETYGGIGGNFLELETGVGPWSNYLYTGHKDEALAMGMVTGELSVEVRDPMKFAGYYGDYIYIYIAANI